MYNSRPLRKRKSLTTSKVAVKKQTLQSSRSLSLQIFKFLVFVKCFHSHQSFAEASSIDLSMLGNMGLQLNGASDSDQAGGSVSSAGDVNGDGYPDVLIGASAADPFGRNNAGSAYLVFGKPGLTSSIDFAAFSSTDGVIIFGALAGDRSGLSVSGAGDVNDDGFDDILIGAPEASPFSRSRAGSTALIYGSSSLPSTIDLASFDSSLGVIFHGAVANDQSGYSVSSAGDINNDTYSDILIGALKSSPLGRGSAGSAILVYGAASLSSSIDLATITSGNAGVIYQGANENDWSGWSVSSAGDVNNDGYSDMLVSSYQASPMGRSGAGITYLLQGQASLPSIIDLATINMTSYGTVIYGAVTGDSSGYSSKTAGDFNNDGYADILIGAPFADALGRSSAGKIYLIMGNSSFPSVLDLAAFDMINGIAFDGAMASDWTGDSVNTAGDLNNDNCSDILIGAPLADPLGRDRAGVAYLILGSTSLPSTIDLAMLNTTNYGVVYQGPVLQTRISSSLSPAGDINNDGYVDFLIGASIADPYGRHNAGTTFVIYGNISMPKITAAPTFMPTTLVPTESPTLPPTTPQPTESPTTLQPSGLPTIAPSTISPTTIPTIIPTTLAPITLSPTPVPTPITVVSPQVGTITPTLFNTFVPTAAIPPFSPTSQFNLPSPATPSPSENIPWQLVFIIGGGVVGLSMLLLMTCLVSRAFKKRQAAKENHPANNIDLQTLPMNEEMQYSPSPANATNYSAFPDRSSQHSQNYLGVSVALGVAPSTDYSAIPDQDTLSQNYLQLPDNSTRQDSYIAMPSQPKESPTYLRASVNAVSASRPNSLGNHPNTLFSNSNYRPITHLANQHTGEMRPQVRK